jgi:hypothetical protein
MIVKTYINFNESCDSKICYYNNSYNKFVYASLVRWLASGRSVENSYIIKNSLNF